MHDLEPVVVIGSSVVPAGVQQEFATLQNTVGAMRAKSFFTEPNLHDRVKNRGGFAS
jgi:hypothetical protein